MTKPCAAIAPAVERTLGKGEVACSITLAAPFIFFHSGPFTLVVDAAKKGQTQCGLHRLKKLLYQSIYFAYPLVKSCILIIIRR